MMIMDIKEDDKYKKRNRQLQQSGTFLILIMIVLATVGFGYYQLYSILPLTTSSTSGKGNLFSNRKDIFVKENEKRKSAVRRRDTTSLDGKDMASKLAHIDLGKMKMVGQVAASIRDAAMRIQSPKGKDLNLERSHRTSKDSTKDLETRHDKRNVNLENDVEHDEESDQEDEHANKEHDA